MKVLVLNGSPRPNGITASMISVFKEAAENKGHEVAVIDVCRKNIKGCLACEFCHNKGEGRCVQKADLKTAVSLPTMMRTSWKRSDRWRKRFKN